MIENDQHRRHFECEHIGPDTFSLARPQGRFSKERKKRRRKISVKSPPMEEAKKLWSIQMFEMQCPPQTTRLSMTRVFEMGRRMRLRQ